MFNMEGQDKEATRKALKELLLQMLADFAEQEARALNGIDTPLDYPRVSGQLMGVIKFMAFRLNMKTEEELDGLVLFAHKVFLKHLDPVKHEPLVHYSRAYMAQTPEEAEVHLERAVECQIKNLVGNVVRESIPVPIMIPTGPPN